MIGWADILLGGVLPCAVAVAIVLGGRRLQYPPGAVWAAAVAAGYVFGHVGLAALDDGLSSALASVVSPHDAQEWLPLLSLIALGAAIVIVLAPESWRRLSVALVLLVSAAVPARLLASSVYVTQRWSNFEQALWLVGLTVAFAAMWITLAKAGQEGAVWIRPPLVILFSMGLAMIQLMSGSLDLGFLSGVGTAALTGTAVAALLPFWPQDGRSAIAAGLSGAAGVITIVLGGLIFLGVFYSHLTRLNAVLLCISLAAAGGRLPPAVTNGRTAHAVVRGVLCLVPLAIALIFAAIEFAANLPEQGEYE